MDIALAIFTIVIGLTNARSVAQDDCPVRDPRLHCERPCTPDTGCRIGRQCECAGECGWSCIRQGCPSLSAPENGGVTIDSDDRSIGSTAIYTCSDGYTLQGTPVRTCQENKTWSEGDEVSCECTKNNDEVNRLGRECARPCSSDGICLQADYSCICDGICGESCIAVGKENYCDTSLLSANHATYTVDPQTAEYGSIAIYTCVDGYSPAGGDSERTCTGGKSWNGSALVCWPNPGSACFDPPVVENANHNGSKEYYMAGELLYYTCDHGYYRDGSLPPLLRCQQTGDTLAWGNFDMTCLPTSCGPPEGIDHGRIEGSVYSFLSVVTYVCDIGYRIQGLETRRCQRDQEWSGSLPQCNPIPESQKCSMQQDPPDGQWIRGSGCQDGQSQFPRCELSYTCNGGYVPANPGVVYVCMGPAWDQREEPLCERATSCGHPGNTENGRIEGTVYSFSRSVTYVCDNGFRIQGNATRHCQANQEWSGDLPQCIPVVCRTLSAPENGKIIGSNHGYDDEVSFICNDGFILNGVSNLRCQHDGTWSSPPPTCNTPSSGANTLMTFSDITTTSINVSWSALDQTSDVDFDLIVGYQIQFREAEETDFQAISVGRSLFYLFDNLTEDTEYEFRLLIFWNHTTFEEGLPSSVQSQRTLPKSIPEICSIPQDPINGQWVKGSGCQDGQDQFPECELSYTCNEEYVPANTSVVYVCSGPAWVRREEPLCLPVFLPDACYDPPVVKKGSHNGSKDYYLPGELLVYTCDFGYYTENAISLLMCNQTGDTVAWGNFDMTCLPVECGILSAPENGAIAGDNHGYNDEVSFTCNDGFILDGASNLTCQHDGTWSSSTPTCRGACYDPPVVEYANHNGTKEYYRAGELLVYACDVGYHKGNSIPLLLCEETGDTVFWGSFRMVCLPLGCGHPGNIEHGRAEGRVYSVRSSVTYVCDIGYKLQGNATRHCQADQKWSGDLPKCIIIASESCSNSDLPYGLLAEGESNRQGFTPNNDWLRVQCEDNLQLSGGHLLKCENGEWKKTTSCDGDDNEVIRK